MKRFLLLFSVVGMVMLGACTSEPFDKEPDVEFPLKVVENGCPVQGDVDFDILNQYQGGIEDATYTSADGLLYIKDDLTKGKWELDTEVYYGGDSPMPSRIIVKDGTLWEPVMLFSCATGPTAFATALRVVNKVLNRDYKAYVARKFSVDAEKYKLNLGNLSYNVAMADKQTIVLSFESRFENGRTHNGGYFLEFCYYTKTEPLNFDDGNNLHFNSVAEAYDWLIEQFETNLGEQVNLNWLGGAIYDNPYFYLSTLKAERDKFAGV